MVVDYQLYYMDTLHRDIMVKVGSQVAEGDRGVSREGVADLMYEGNLTAAYICHLSVFFFSFVCFV